MTVLAAHAWPTNGKLIRDVAELYLDCDTIIHDPTYGRGLWWTEWQPDPGYLTKSDVRPMPGIDFRADFRRLPLKDGTLDAVAFDPPYVCVGGRSTTGLPDLHDRYGLTDAPSTPEGIQQDINLGLAEAVRVTRPRGLILVKCQDYISSGRLQPGTFWTQTYADWLGLSTVDRFEHVAGVRPQPPGRRQVHARRNLSTLFVFRTPRR